MTQKVLPLGDQALRFDLRLFLILWDRLFPALKEQAPLSCSPPTTLDEAEQLCDRLVVVDEGHHHGRGAPTRSHHPIRRELLETRFSSDNNARRSERVTGRGPHRSATRPNPHLRCNDGDADLDRIIPQKGFTPIRASCAARASKTCSAYRANLIE
jgi:lipooligosaccharide transport system ATP-binding protein